MVHRITAEHLVTAATQAITEELFRKFSKTLLSFCNEAQGRIAIFRTLRYTRIRLHILRKYCSRKKRSSADDPQLRFLDMAIGYIDTELEILQRYGIVCDTQLHESLHRWTGAFVELTELVYGLQETGRIDEGKVTINELGTLFGRMFGVEFKDSHCYNAYTDMKRRKSESRTYFLDEMRERLNLRMQRDDAKERARR